MTLTLSIANVDTLENGESTKLVLDRHGALIGRSPNADWSLPDPQKHISFTHCEIVYRGGQYLLLDKSTNGTFLNGSRDRLTEAHVLANGDEFAIGQYRVLVRVAAAPGVVERPAAPKPPGSDWGWDSGAAQQQQQPPPSNAWGDLPAEKPQGGAWPSEPPAAAISGRGAMSDNWTPPRPEAPPPVPPGADVWARYDRANQVDWDGGGFGSTPPPTPPSKPAAAWGAPEPEAPPPAERRSAAGADEAWNALMSAAGLTPADLKVPPSQVGKAAGSILNRLVAGLVLMLEARARAKTELGAASTMIEINGNNPLKFLRNPEAALSRLLNPPERGFMDGERAVEDAFKDLQAHQMASLAAMQGALRATLARFSPSAIRSRAEAGGLLGRIMPGAAEAALWQAYEREFEGVVKGSDEAFMDFFAKAFRDAYMKANAEMRRR